MASALSECLEAVAAFVDSISPASNDDETPTLRLVKKRAGKKNRRRGRIGYKLVANASKGKPAHQPARAHNTALSAASVGAWPSWARRSSPDIQPLQAHTHTS